MSNTEQSGSVLACADRVHGNANRNQESFMRGFSRSTMRCQTTCVDSRVALFCAVLLFSAQPVQASDYAAALKARNYAEAERDANAALASNPRDPAALVAKIDTILAV